MAAFAYPKGVRFECTRCAVCCMDTKVHVRHILMLEAEAKQISRVSLESIEEFAVKVASFEPYTYEMKKSGEKKCFFLDGNHCRIYSVRPLVCRFYPFQLSRGKGKKYRFSVTAECPGLGKGGPLKREFFENMICQACEKLG